MDEPVSHGSDQPERPSDAFRARARDLGLGKLGEADLAALERGWRGLQPQLRLVREGLQRSERPARHGR